MAWLGVFMFLFLFVYVIMFPFGFRLHILIPFGALNYLYFRTFRVGISEALMEVFAADQQINASLATPLDPIDDLLAGELST